VKRIPLAAVLGLLCFVAFSLITQQRAAADRAPGQDQDQPAAQVTQTVATDDGKVTVKQDGATDEVEFVPGEVLVKFKDAEEAAAVARGRQNAQGALASANAPGLNRLFARFDVVAANRPFKRGKADALPRVVKLTTRAGKTDPEHTRALVAELRQQPEVEYAEPNVIMHAQVAPNDPYYATSGAWGQPFRDLWGLQAIGAEAAWDTTQGAGVLVAVVDTGLDYNHEDIAANVWQNAGETGTDALGRDKRTNGVDDDGDGYVDDWRGWDFVTLDGTPADNDPMDNHGHGTHVSGTIAAVGNNGLGVVGVAPGAKVLAVKGLDASGSGSTEDLANAIIYAADRGAAVINNSWGGSGDTPQTLADAVAYAHTTKGAVVVAAAGNSNADVGAPAKGFFPACLRDAVAVAAVTHTDAKAYYSNYGAKLDVAAPGGGDTDPTGLIVQPDRSILSLLSSAASSSMTGSGQLVVGTKYLRQSGTSMAAPHVAGVAALVRAQHPEYTPEQVRQVLRQSSDDIGAVGFDNQFGYGRVNAARAVNAPAPLAAQLTGPAGTLTGLTQVDVTGTVAGPDLATWRLEYGAGTAPASWTQITSSSAPVSAGVLASWDLSNVSDGTYTLRLVAQTVTGQPYEDRLTVVLDSLVITDPSPLSISVVRGGQTVTIRGTVAAANFARYGVSVLAVNSNTWVSSSAISVPNDGLQRVRDGVIATWNTAGAAGDMYKIYVTEIFTNNSSVYKSVQLLVDPALHAGWPKNIPYLGTEFAHLGLTNHLNAYDVDGNGTKELVVAYNNLINVYDHTGAQLPGWPRNIDPQNTNAHIQVSPAVADLDGDGSPEIVAANDQNQVFVFRANGTLWAGWPKTLSYSIGTRVAVDDVNGDGTKEIIITTTGRVAVVNTSGAYLPGWPVYLNGAGTTPAAIGDVDGDGQKDIVVATDAGPTNLYVISATGVVKPGWPRAINPTLPSNYTASSYPALGDLDGDGKLEVVIGSTDGQVYALRYDGSNLAGWPRATKAARVNSPAVGDIDGDGLPEVVAGNYYVIEGGVYSNYLFAWHGDGTPLAGWPVKYDKTISSTYFGFGAPALVDLDQDGRADVLVSSDANANTPFALNAYKSDGTKVAGFPKATLSIGADSTNTAAVADLDGDGALELAWIDSRFNIFVWDLPTPTGVVAPWPQFQHDERHTGLSLRTPEVIPPTVAITTPADGASVAGAVNVSVQAADNVGVARVELYQNGALAGTLNASPYNFSWDTRSAPDGFYTLTAKAYDEAGNAATSAPAIIKVDNTAPTAALTAPAAGAVVGGSAVTLSASASDGAGVRQVDFYLDNGILLGSDTTAPYSVNWNTTTAASDTHALYVVATDTLGNSATSASVNVTVDNAPPVVSLSAPANGATVRATVAVAASAADNVAVQRVDFYRDANVLIGSDTTAPYQINWDSTTVSAGTHTLYAVGTDTAGNTAAGATLSVVVDNAAPTCALTGPASGALLTGAAVSMTANATDNNAVSRVEFYRDNSVLLGTATTAPYAASWNTTTAADGAHTLYAVAFDAAGNSTGSAVANVTVDNLAPTVSLTAPAYGSVVSGSAVALTANATDNVAVAKVEFYLDSNILLGADTTAPYSFNWNSTTYPSGAHTLYAVATDTAGNPAASASVAVTVDNAVPTVTITSPLNNASVTRNTTVTIAANATDNLGVTRVEFYVSGALKCTDTAAPYNCAWLVPNTKTTYNLQAKAYDARGNVGTHAVNVTAK
jgi:subtilisin family serine protease